MESSLSPDVVRRIYGMLHPGAQRAVARTMRLPSGVARPNATNYTQGGGRYAAWWREGHRKLTALATRLRGVPGMEMAMKLAMAERAALVELKKNYKRGDAHMKAAYSSQRRRQVASPDSWRDAARFHGMTRNQIADQVLRETRESYDALMFQLKFVPPTGTSQAEAQRRARVSKAERRSMWTPAAPATQVQRRQRRLQRRAARRPAAPPPPPPAAVQATGVVGSFPVRRYVPGQGWLSPTTGLTNSQILAQTAAARLRR